jgi:hypothetical protein
MDALVKAIKLLSPNDFHHLCFAVLREMYPNARIQSVEGAAGDDGIDLLGGELEIGATVFQCKAFSVTIIGKSQRQQIRDSLKTALSKAKPKNWVLCLNMNFDPASLRWFQRLQKSYQELGVNVADPFSASELALQLAYRRTLKSMFFPGLALDVSELRSLAIRSNDLDDQALTEIATESAEELIQRLNDMDGRIVHEITFGGERGPSNEGPGTKRDILASLSDGTKTIKAYARDHQALFLDPIRFNIQASESAIKKFDELSSTGRSQRFSGDEVKGFFTDLPLLRLVNFTPGSFSVEVGHVLDEKPIPMRLTFRNGQGTETLNYVEFSRKRTGSLECEIEANNDQPVPMRLIIPWDGEGSGQITVSTHLVGRPIRRASTQSKILRMLQLGCDIELYSLSLDARLGILKIDPNTRLAISPEFLVFLEELERISDFFKVPLFVPQNLTKDDEVGFELLKGAALGTPIPLGDVTMQLKKSETNENTFEQSLRKIATIAVQHEHSTIRFLGNKFELGPHVLHFQEVEFIDFEEALRKFRAAPIGDSVELVMRPLGPTTLHFVGSGEAVENFS